MTQSFVFLADGFEEIEAITTVDILRRAGMDVKTVAVASDQYVVTGAHNIAVAADITLDEFDSTYARWLIIPGGMPGASNCAASAVLMNALKAHAQASKPIAAICAAPAVVLAEAGLLKGITATCYPGFEDKLKSAGAQFAEGRVVSDGNFVTANGPASAADFALAIVAQTCGQGVADDIAGGLLK